MSVEPVADDQATFVLEQFRVAAGGRLEIQGTWDGVPGSDLEQPVLVLHFADRIDDVDADRVRGTARKWYASFPWDGDPESIRKAVLHVAGRLRVDLGPHPTTRRRLGRTALPALALLGVPGSVVPEVVEADILSTHTELTELRDRLAAVEEEAQRARDDAAQAWAEAERARVLRERESERLHDAMDALRRSAHDAVETDRERLRMQGIELEQLRAEVARLREVEAERDEARAARDEARTAGDEVRAELDESRRTLELLGGQAERARAQLAELETYATQAGAELERVRDELEHSRRSARAAEEELARASKDRVTAHRLREELDHLEAALAAARRAETEATADAAALRDRVAEIWRALDEV
jgi:hypothetical protein